MSQTPTESAPAPGRRRGSQTVTDMVRSLGVVLLVVAVILIITPREHSDPTPEIDYATELASARRGAPYALLAPQALPATWDATSVRYRTAADGDVTWHLGFETPSDQYAGLEQSDGDSEAFVATQSLGGRPDGRVELEGRTWERYVSTEQERRSLVRVTDGVTVVVAGSAGWGELQRLATALRPG
ncbi:MAG: DUF4245 domain-containing protein [Actinomycetes bacterium]